MSSPAMRRPIAAMRDRFREELGERIREAREQTQLRQCDLAKLLGVSPKTMSQYEDGTALPNAWDLACIAEELDCTVEELVPITERRR